MNTSWNATLQHLDEKAEAAALVTIFSSKGSTPREVGSKMVVTLAKSYYSIGGGHLEHQAIKLARHMLEQQDSQAFIKAFSLGASLGQCCGGQVELLFEAFFPVKHNVVIFGAGHIAKALVPILGQLPCRVQWIDKRTELFTDNLPDNVQSIILDDAPDHIEQLATQLPANSYILIMTHNHQLDQILCEALLRQPPFGFIGLIGSNTKWKKFALRLANKGFSHQQIQRVHCPIGITPNNGKLPMEIAVSVAAHFIEFYQRPNT